MPYYMHQWKYKDELIKKMTKDPEDRSQIIRVAAGAFDGKLHNFYLCFGEFDGMAITSFPNNESAYACLLMVFGEGNLAAIQTTVLFTMAEGLQAMKEAKKVREVRRS